MTVNSTNKAAVASSTAAGQDVANLLTSVAVDDLVYQDLVAIKLKQDLHQRWPLFNTAKPGVSSAKNLTDTNLASAAITSPYIAMYGLRGGVGTTSMVAGLGWALAQLQHKVLLVDVATTPLLGQHFNCPSDSVPLAENQAYKQRLWELTPDLHLLDWQAALGANPDARLDLACTALTPELVARYAWVLLDLGCIPSGAEAKLARLRSTAQHSTCAETKLVKSSNLDSATAKNSWVLSSLALAKVDAATHLLLQEPASSKAMLLLNSYIPESRLQSDLLLSWRSQTEPALNLAPLVVHQDEAWNEALAFKSPVGLYKPSSQAAKELVSLAIWCQAQVGQVAR